MNTTEAKVSVTITRDQLIDNRRNPEGCEFLAARVIIPRLLERGIPVIGLAGIIGVEWGKLTIEHEDGLDGDEWTYTFVGNLIPKAHMPKLTGGIRFIDPLGPKIAAAQAAADDEL